MEALLFLIIIGLGIALYSKSKNAKQIKADLQFRNEELSNSVRDLQGQVKSLSTARDDLQKKAEDLDKSNTELTAEVFALEALRPVLDAKREAERILKEARTEASEAQRHADLLRTKTEQEISVLLANAHRTSQSEISKAEEEAKTIRSRTNQTLKESQYRIEAMLRSANREATGIIDRANKRAEEIAGTAYEVVQNSERFERVAKAMKNLIDGYGDQYVIPSRSLLDELAEEYGFTEAGEELKNARERTRLMVKGNTAATCDYVENHRRETAIRFVVDAFNGKVDSILSRVKDNNVGTLGQEIRDAFNLVNHNGAAFRSARILDVYLEARLTELRWAVTVQEIKLRDREEQRRIKDQIREEERAQREFERSMREAAKEEESLRKAMEKVQAQVEKASDEQRGKFEAQLAELTERLRLAEEKNQRAISMAQQTRMGHVYVISNIGSFGEDVFKIGLTRRLEPLDRIHELGSASVPFSFDVHTMIFSEDAPALERALHRHFLTGQVNKVNPRKEFFRVPLKTIKEEIETLGISCKWTLASEAREYRETLAIERALLENPQKGREWLEQQKLFEPTVQAMEEEEEIPV